MHSIDLTGYCIVSWEKSKNIFFGPMKAFFLKIALCVPCKAHFNSALEFKGLS